MTDPLFQVRNAHGASSGDPPIVNGNDAEHYTGYFAGPEGDQLVFRFNRHTKKAELRSGDPGWTGAIDVIDGVPVGATMYFSNAERLWLVACWMAATETDYVPHPCSHRVRFMSGMIDPELIESLARR